MQCIPKPGTCPATPDIGYRTYKNWLMPSGLRKSCSKVVRTAIKSQLYWGSEITACTPSKKSNQIAAWLPAAPDAEHYKTAQRLPGRLSTVSASLELELSSIQLPNTSSTRPSSIFVHNRCRYRSTQRRHWTLITHKHNVPLRTRQLLFDTPLTAIPRFWWKAPKPV